MERQSNEVYENAIKSANGLSDASKTSYLKQLRQALKLLKPRYTDILLDPEGSNSKLNSLVKSKTISQNTARSIVAALLSLFKHATAPKGVQPDWTKVLEEHNKKVTDWTEQNRLTPREEEGWLTHDQWIAKEKELRRDQPGSQTHLIVAFHALTTPLRGGDLFDVKLVKPSDPDADESKGGKQDVLVWQGVDKPSRLLIRSHKTRKQYPVLVRELPVELRRIVDESLKLNPRTYLFVNAKGKPWSRSSFLAWKSKTFLDVFHKPVTTNLARHAYVTSSKSKNESIADQRKKALEMGHSLQTHNEYRKIV